MREADVICPGCDFVLDTSFLGDDITDDLAPNRPPPPPVGDVDSNMFGDDAVILGSGVDEYASFDAESSGFVQREATNARIYLGGNMQALLAPDAIPGVKDGVDPDALNLSPYERHVLQFVNGRRPVGRIRKKSGMEDPELKLALAMMADKGVIQLAGVVDEERKARARERRRQKLHEAKHQKGQEGKERRERKDRKKRSSSSGEAKKKAPSPKANASTKKADASAKNAAPPAKKRRSPGAADAPPPVEATRLEALPASLRDELAKGAPAAERPPGPVRGHATTPPEGEETRQRRKRPRLPASMRARSMESDALSEVSGLAAASEPSQLDEDPRAEQRAVISGIEPTSIRRAPIADHVEPDGVFSSSADAVPERSISEEPARPPPRPSVPRPPRGGASAPPEGPYLDEADAFEQGSATVALDAVGQSLDMPSIEVVEPDAPLGGGPSFPPPLPDDHSMLSHDPVGDEAEVFDLPTGPLAPVPVAADDDDDDDSLLPTGEGPDEPVSIPLPISEEPGRSPDPLAAHDVFFSSQSGGAVVPPTGEVDPLRPLTLPSDALEPLPPSPPVPLIPLPGQGAAPSWVPPLPGMGVPATPPPGAPLLSIEDDDDAMPAPPAVAAPAPAHVEPPSEEAPPLLAHDDDSDEESDEQPSGSVSFENRRKAEKIFEQAQDDFQKGNIGSARMNAKLATIYDPFNKQYKQALETWSKPGEDAKEPGGPVRQDVQFFEQARLAESRGQYEKAVYLLKKAADLNPKAAPVFNLLGVIQATRLKQYKEASDALLRACELSPGNLSFKNNLGKVLGMQESARDKMKVERNDEDDMVKVRKIRPKFF